MTVIAKGGEIAAALQYAKFEEGTVIARKATGRITFTANPTSGNTVTIGTITYSFQTTLAAANDVKIATTKELTARNLDYAIRDVSANEGTSYGTGTSANTAAVSELASSAAVVFLTAPAVGKASNTTSLTKVGSSITVSASTLLGGLDGGTFARSTLNWKRARSLAIDYGAQQMQEVFPDEIGGVYTPTGAYKSGVAVAGGSDMLPRLGDAFGEVLFAAFGKDTVTSSGGVGTHTLQFRTDIANEIPWVAVRKMIPGRDNVAAEGLYGFDNKVVNLKLNLGAGRPISGRIDFVGRYPELDHHPEVWPGASFEDFTANPIGCKGYFKLPTIFTNSLPTTGVVLEFMNETSTMKEEQHYGNYYMGDIVVKARKMMVRFVYKWDSAEMYQRGFGGVGATTWSPTPFTTTFDGGSNYAFEIKMEAPYNIPSTTTPYSLTVKAYNCFWQPNGDPVEQGNNIVAQEWMGTVLDYNGNYADLVLVNGNTSAYSLPVEP